MCAVFSPATVTRAQILLQRSWQTFCPTTSNRQTWSADLSWPRLHGRLGPAIRFHWKSKTIGRALRGGLTDLIRIKVWCSANLIYLWCPIIIIMATRAALSDGTWCFVFTIKMASSGGASYCSNILLLSTTCSRNWKYSIINSVLLVASGPILQYAAVFHTPTMSIFKPHISSWRSGATKHF